MPKVDTVNEIVKSMCLATKEVLEAATQSRVAFAPTIQKIPTTQMRPDVGCFVQFSGDFSGLVIMNFTGAAAVEIYQSYMAAIGMPLEGLPDSHTSDEVADSIGELVNQIVGKLRRELESLFGIIVYHNQPKVVTIAKTLLISIATEIARPQCRRMSFKTEKSNSFHVEIGLEQTEFIPLFEKEKEDDLSPEELMARFAAGGDI